MDKNRKIIWTNDDYDGWCKSMLIDGEEDLSYEAYSNECEIWLDDEHANLNIPLEGYIVAFADLGLWDGHHNGAKAIGRNVRDILSSNCDLVTWFCDRYNVRCEETHHDGNNSIIYRLAKNREHAERIVNKIAYEGMTKEQFMKATKSLKPFIDKVYGW